MHFWRSCLCRLALNHSRGLRFLRWIVVTRRESRLIVAMSPKDYDVNPARDKRGLTKPQAIFADNILEVGKEKAAEMAYPDADPESHRKLASENLKHPQVLSNISKIADSKGLTKDACVEAIKDGLGAVKKAFSKEGDEIEYADTPSRLKAAELGLKVHGELKNTEQGSGVQMTKDVFVELCSVFWGTKPQ